MSGPRPRRALSTVVESGDMFDIQNWYPRLSHCSVRTQIVKLQSSEIKDLVERGSCGTSPQEADFRQYISSPPTEWLSMMSRVEAAMSRIGGSRFLVQFWLPTSRRLMPCVNQYKFMRAANADVKYQKQINAQCKLHGKDMDDNATLLAYQRAKYLSCVVESPAAAVALLLTSKQVHCELLHDIATKKREQSEYARNNSNSSSSRSSEASSFTSSSTLTKTLDVAGVGVGVNSNNGKKNQEQFSSLADQDDTTNKAEIVDEYSTSHFCLIIREWNDMLRGEWRFRIFVRNGKLTACTQAHQAFVPDLLAHGQSVQDSIAEFVETSLRSAFFSALADFAADLILDPVSMRSSLTNIMPFPPACESYLFDWQSETDRSILNGNAEYELRILSTPLPHCLQDLEQWMQEAVSANGNKQEETKVRRSSCALM